SVLHEAVEHAAGLNGQDELRVRLDELDFLLLNVVRDCVARVANVVAAVDPLSVPGPRDLLDRQVPDDARSALFRTQFEVLPEELCDHLEVLREEVRFFLRMELRDVPSFRSEEHTSELQSR